MEELNDIHFKVDCDKIKAYQERIADAAAKAQSEEEKRKAERKNANDLNKKRRNFADGRKDYRSWGMKHTICGPYSIAVEKEGKDTKPKYELTVTDFVSATKEDAEKATKECNKNAASSLTSTLALTLVCALLLTFA